MASPTLRRALPKPSSALPPRRSAVPSASSSSSSIALPTTSLVLPLAWSHLPSISSLFGNPILTSSYLRNRSRKFEEQPPFHSLLELIQTRLKRFHQFDQLFGRCEACSGSPLIETLTDILRRVRFRHVEETRARNDCNQYFRVLDRELEGLLFVGWRGCDAEELHVE